MRRVITVIITIALIGIIFPLGTGVAEAANPPAEAQFVSLMNQERGARGLGLLSVSSDLVDYARRHSDEMATSQQLYHSTQLKTLSNWDMLGENVGRGGSVQALHDAFMNSTEHRDNILRPNFSQVGVGVDVTGGTIWVTVVFRDPHVDSASSATTTSDPSLDSVVSAMADPLGRGFWEVYGNGRIVTKGSAPFFGDASGISHTPIIASIAAPDGSGYWLISDRGGVYTFGKTAFYGSAANLPIVGKVVTGMPSPGGHGYFLVTDRGAVYAFGDAAFHGAATNIPNSGIVDAVLAPGGKGYWLISSVGGVYTFGNIPFYGSAANLAIVGSIRNAVPHPSGQGYWLLTDRGGVYTFGNIPFFGAATDLSPEPFVDAVADPLGRGDWLVTASGNVYAFGNVPSY